MQTDEEHARPLGAPHVAGAKATFQVSVVMATFNGAAYIERQLDSLAGQHHRPEELIVCDDLSNDGTLDVVSRFARRAPFPVRAERNAYRLGFGDNFIKAASRATAPWVAFCDQDDEWEPTKLAAAANAADDDNVLAITHPSRVLDGDRLTSKLVGLRDPGSFEPLSLHPLDVINGHSLVFRRLLLDVLAADQRPISAHARRSLMPHDDWITFLAGSLGRTVVLPDPQVRYRFHDNNVSQISKRRAFTLERLRTARQQGAGEVEKKRFAAEQRALQMRRVVTDNAVLAVNAQRAVTHYEDLVALLERRSEVWKRPSRTSRLVGVAGLSLQGAYGHFAKGGIGVREGLKDLLFGVLLS